MYVRLLVLSARLRFELNCDKSVEASLLFFLFWKVSFSIFHCSIEDGCKQRHISRSGSTLVAVAQLMRRMCMCAASDAIKCCGLHKAGRQAGRPAVRSTMQFQGSVSCYPMLCLEDSSDALCRLKPLSESSLPQLLVDSMWRNSGIS